MILCRNPEEETNVMFQLAIMDKEASAGISSAKVPLTIYKVFILKINIVT